MLIGKQEMLSGIDFFSDNYPLDIEPKIIDKIKKSVSEMDYRQYTTIKYLQDNHKILNKKEWNDIYEQFKHVPAIKQLILSFKEAPLAIVDKAVAETDIVRHNIKGFTMQPKDDVEVFKLALTRELNPSTLNLIKDYITRDFMTNMTQYRYTMSAEDLKKFHQNSINMMCEKLIEIFQDISTNDITYPELYIFSLNTDKDFIYQISEEDRKTMHLHEQIRENIINNKILDISIPTDQKLINELFNAGTDYNTRTNICTEEMVKTMIEEQKIWENYLTKINDNGYPKNLHNKETQMLGAILTRIAKTGMLPVSIQIDLAHRFTSQKSTEYNALLEELYTNTKEEAVIRILMNLPDKFRKKMLQNNPNIPNDIVYKQTDKMFQKMRNSFNKGAEDTIPSSWYSEIPKYSKRTRLRDADYNTLLCCKTFKPIAISIAIQDTVPDNILNKMIELQKNILDNPQNETIKDFEEALRLSLRARINKGFRENNLVTTSHPAAILFSLFNVSLSVNKEFIENNKNYEHHSIQTTIKNYFSDETIDDFIKVLKEVQQKTDNKYEKNILQSTLNIFTEEKERRDREKYLEENDYNAVTIKEIPDIINNIYGKRNSFISDSNSLQAKLDLIAFVETCFTLKQKLEQLSQNTIKKEVNNQDLNL